MASTEPILAGIFPLQLVVYPGEKLNLHIFEPRYKQLITECRDQNKSFIVPPFINGNVQSVGTEMELIKVIKTYDDGKMDITTHGVGRVDILQVYNPYPGRLYGGAEVRSISDIDDGTLDVIEGLLEMVKVLYSLLDIKRPIPVASETFSVYDIAHHVGLNAEQEYHLLTLPSERERQIYVTNHLRDFIPKTRQMLDMQVKARQNGHFKDLDPINW